MKAPPLKERGSPRAEAAPNNSVYGNNNIKDTEGKPLTHSDRFRPRAEDAARQIIRSWCDYGPKQASMIDTETLPGIHAEVARRVVAAVVEGAVGFDGIYPHFIKAPLGILKEFCECNQAFSPRPQDCGPLHTIIAEYHKAHQVDMLADKLRMTLERAEDPTDVVREFVALETDNGSKSDSLIVYGVNSYPTEIPPASILLGNGWGRLHDILTLISTAGAGKSVAVIQAAIAWALGCPYMGILPARPLRILLFSGEDDGVTLGQCREGFLDHSEAIIGRKLSAADLEPLDSMIRTEYSREHVGARFHTHLDRLLREAPADLVIVNPLLSYVGGEIVACASEWLRAGLMPIIQKHDCAALLAHHTGKMAKDGWDNTDDTYSAIGGGEMANIPRAILTLRPTAADGLSVLKVSKRQTTGWQDADGNLTTSYFVKRTDDPTRPAWLPVDSDEAKELIDASKPAGGSGKGSRKVTVEHVINALKTGDMQRQGLIAWLMRECHCSERPARDAINDAMKDDDNPIRTYTETSQRGGKALRWFGLNREVIQ